MFNIKSLTTFVVLVFYTDISETKSNYQKIAEKTFADGYDAGLRPVINHKTTTHVKFRFGLIQLLNVEEKEQNIQLVGYVEMNWHDEFLKWDPSDYDNLTRFRYPHDKVWKPEIILTNTPDLNDGPAIREASTNVVINYDGIITNSFIAVFKFTCRNLSLVDFPFDTHTCFLEFGSWTYSGSEVDIDFTTYDYELPHSMQEVPSTEWDFTINGYKKHIEWECCPNETYPYVRVYMTIKRKPLYYIVHLIIPTIVTCYVSFFGMFNPTSSGGDRTDKAFLGLCTLFTFTLLLLNVSSEMPVTSNAVTLMGYFLGFLVIIIASAVITTSIIMNVHLRWQGGKPLSTWTRRWIVHRLGTWLWLYIPKDTYFNSFDGNNIHQTKKLKKTTGVGFNNEKNEELVRLIEDKIIPLNEVIVAISENIRKEEYIQAVKDDYGMLCAVLDRICLIFFILLTTIYAIILFAPFYV